MSLKPIVSDGSYQTLALQNFIISPKVSVDDITQQLSYTFGTPAVNFILGTPAGDGLIDYLDPAVIIPGSLVGPPFTIDGVGVVTPQIQAMFTGANQIPFYSVHDASDLIAALDLMGAFNGTPFGYLTTGQYLRFIGAVSPTSTSTYALTPGGLVIDAESNHSAGVNPVRVYLLNGGGQVRVNSDGSITLETASGTAAGNWDFLDNVTVEDDLDVQGATTTQDVTAAGLITGNAGAFITQDDAVVAATMTIRQGTSNTVGLTITDDALTPKVGIGVQGGDGAIVTDRAQFGLSLTSNGQTILGATSADDIQLNGTISTDAVLGTAGKGIQIKEGSNATMGRAVLVAGTVTVSTTAVRSDSEIFLTTAVPGGAVGVPRITAIVNGTSFDIGSSTVGDTSTISWLIINPAP